MSTQCNITVRKSLLVILTLIICISFLFVSCPLAPPEDPARGFNPYLAPSSPTKVRATNGTLNKITLEWDASENATSYQVWMLKSEDYGAVVNSSKAATLNYSNLQERGFRFVEDITTTKYELTNQPAGSAYIFAIVAMRDLGPSVTTVGQRVLYSNPSALFEGGTVGNITLSAVATSQTITLYWDVPNIFKTIPIVPGANEPLYDYSFVLEYKLKNDPDIASNWHSVDGVGQEFNHEINIAMSGLAVDTTYEFRISMKVFDENGSGVATVQSIKLPVTTETNMIPDKIESLTVTEGSIVDGIKLTWTAPKIPAGLNVSNIFQIERRIAGDSNAGWDVVLNAAKDAPIQKGINEREYFWTDTTAADNTKYEYRVLNGYINDSDVPFLQDEDADITKSSPGWKLWLPTSVSGTFTPSEGENPTSGSLAISWTYENALSEGVAWKLEIAEWNQKDGATAITTEDKNPSSVGDVYSDTQTITVGDASYIHTFEFKLEFLFNGEVVKSLPVSTTPQTVSLGKSSSAVLVENFAATQNLVGNIKLSWNVTSELTGESYRIWEDGKELEGLPTLSEEGDSRSLTLKTSGTHTYRLAVTAVYEEVTQTYYEPTQIFGSTLMPPQNLSATDGTSLTQIDVSWDAPANNDNGDIIYELQYKLASAEDSNWRYIDISSLPNPSVAVTDGTGTEQAGVIYDFRMRAYNKKQSTGAENIYTEWTPIEKGNIFGPGHMTLSATQGTNSQKVDLTWNAVEGAVSYTIYRDDIRLKGAYTSTSFTDEDIVKLSSTPDNLTPLSKHYTYKVVPVPSFDCDIDALLGKETYGWLFGPPKNIKASKGAAVGVINVTWDNVEGATSYNLEKYTINEDGTITPQGTVVEGILTNSYDDTTSTIPVYYTVRAVTSTMKSEYQNGFGTTENMFKEQEADNYGYRLVMPPTFFVTEQIDNNSLYRPYVKLTWDRVDGATHYQVQVLGQEYSIDVRGLSYNETVVVDNNVSDTSAGYLSYDPSKKQYSYNDATGVLTDSLIISSYKLNAVNSATSASSGYKEDTTNVRRQLKPQEVVNITNGILKPVLVAANKEFGDDWYAGEGTFGNESRTFSKIENVTIKNSSASAWQDNQSPGSITLNGYESYVQENIPANKVILTTLENIRTWAANGGGAGYLGADPLQNLGSGNSGKVKVTIQGMPSDVTINYNDINVRNLDTSKSYTVTIDGNTTTINDNPSIVRPF